MSDQAAGLRRWARRPAACPPRASTRRFGALMSGALWWAALAMALSWPSAAGAAPGSWSATVAGPRLGLAGRDYASAPLTPPALATGATVQRVRWRYRLPAGRRVQARLCAATHCVPLAGPRGASEALAGVPAAAPLRVRFRLPRGETRALKVGEVRVMVDYR